MMNTRLTFMVATLLVTTLVAGCGGGRPSAEKHLAAAKAFIDKGEPRSAVIELKSALQRKPDNAEARFLLGKLLFDGEEPALSALELRKALELGYSRDAVVPLLAEAMVQQQQHKQVIAEFAQAALDDRKAHASLKTTLGWAYLAGQQWSQAEVVLKQAVSAVPNHLPALLAQARALALRGDASAASKAVDDLIAAGRVDADVWVFKGDLGAAAGDGEGAIAAYRKALAMSPAHTAAHGGVVALSLQKRDLDAATAQLAELTKVRPTHPTTRYFQAQIAYEKRDYKQAREITQELLKMAPAHPVVNQLAGAIELAAGSNEAARAYLGKTLQASPNNVIARRLLVGAHLATGEATKALALLEPLLAMNPPDPVALTLAGEAHMQNGDLESANAAFARSVKASPNTINQTALARTRMLKGDALGAVGDLQQLAAKDSGTTADLELINALLRRRDFKAALTAIDALDKKMPGKPLPAQLRGTALLGLNDAAQARAQFDKALAIDAAYFPAAASLAYLDTQDKKPQAAQARFEAVLKAQPGHLRAMLALAGLRLRNGASAADVGALLTDAVRLNGSEPAAHLALIEHHLRNNQPEAAMAAAQRGEAALPGQPALLDALGRAQMAAGQAHQALSTFNRLAGQKPGHALVHERVADAQLATKDPKSALQNLERAVALKPDSAALLKLFALQMQSGKTADALALARDLQKRHPGHSLGYMLEGEVQAVQKNATAAQAAYEKGLTKSQPGQAAIRYHSWLARSGKAAEAASFAAAWTKDHPKDGLFQLALGDGALARGDLDTSRVAFQRVLDLDPNHVIALNNLAWLLARAQQPGAVALAEKATTLQPNQPVLMDTLAFALAADKQLDKAITTQKKVVELAPEVPTFRLGLARIYLQAGQKAPARELLVPLDKLGDKFGEHAEVKRLLATL
jgi:cellulose synthase operon protein C